MLISSDSRSLPAIIYVRMIEEKDVTHNLIWSRSEALAA